MFQIGNLIASKARDAQMVIASYRPGMPQLMPFISNWSVKWMLPVDKYVIENATRLLNSPLSMALNLLVNTVTDD